MKYLFVACFMVAIMLPNIAVALVQLQNCDWKFREWWQS